MLFFMFKAIDKIYCINLDSRVDRWETCKKELKDVGIMQYERFSAIEDPNGAHGHVKSFCNLIDICLEQEFSNYLILEDDVSFIGEKSEFIPCVDAAISELPNNWDVLYFGGTLCDNYVSSPISLYSEQLYKLHSAFATQAVLFSYKGFKTLRDMFSCSKEWWQEVLSETEGYAFDVFLAKSFLPASNSYITKSILCGQRPGWSDLLNTYTDYNKLMTERFEYYKAKLQ
jgi:GR25 family glycosyltransferase involved in LPS biosynthesis